MRQFIIIISIICFISCVDKKHKVDNQIVLKPPYSDKLTSFDDAPTMNRLPSFDELNEKHFLKIQNVSNATDLNSKFYCITKPGYMPICGGGYKIYFDPNQVMKFCDSLISFLKKDNLAGENDYRINSFQKLKQQAAKSLKYSTKFDENYLHDLLPYCKSSFWDTKTQTRPISLLVKTYKTMCTEKANDYDLITAKGDTVKLINNMEMCMN